MNYICTQTFNKTAIDGNVIVPIGARLILNGNTLIYNGKRICYTTSANCYAHFSRNDDSHGQERFALIQAINARIAELRTKRDETIHAEAYNHAEDEDQAEWMSKIPDEAEEFFESMAESPFLDVFSDGSRRWNHKFYNATIEELQQLQTRLP